MHLKTFYVNKENDYVFCFGKDGKPFNRTLVGKSFRDTCRAAGIKDFRFHGLRHGYCFKTVKRDADVYSFVALDGHKDIKTF